ncbi:hypothetical protein OROMI_013805 [Orobanche minor]
MAEEEVRVEMVAVEAVYSDDCHVIEAYPPHLHVHLKPRTADVSSQQFVEVTIGMRAGPQYPEEPPEISVIDSKGLDEQRQKHLLASIRGKASELASCLMLVALCEEAVERLSSMNHPEGNCPLCLHPLLDEDAGSNSLPFMKLMSLIASSDGGIGPWSIVRRRLTVRCLQVLLGQCNTKKSINKTVEENMGKCPVCRKVFLAKDIEHVLDLVGTDGHLNSSGIDTDGDILYSDYEKIRREKFEAVLKLQQENNGLIEPKRNEVLLPGMFVPQPVVSRSTYSNAISSESQQKDPAAKPDTNPGSSFNRPCPSKQSNFSNMRKQRTQVRHWT